jgi:4-hydroxythreonine-4-phosphate dehydrogenase
VSALPLSSLPLLALSQGDPAGIGPELALRLAAEPPAQARLLLIAERAALAAVRDLVPAGWERLVFVRTAAEAAGVAVGSLAVLDPVGESRPVRPGESGPDDAAGALAALDLGMDLARAGAAQALVTLPVSKASIAHHRLPGFRGHTDYLAERCGLQRYGRDYLMAFLAPDLQVALLTVHEPLRSAIAGLDTAAVVEALGCLATHAGGRIALAGLNPHAGEGGLLGEEEGVLLAPAVATARQRGWDVHGPLPADSLFALARGGAFDWVLALYHDQGLIAVKTASFGQATNWTLGLPFLRTSVDHGTAFDIAGRGLADAEPLRAVIATTLRLVAGELPRRRVPGDDGATSPVGAASAQSL